VLADFVDYITSKYQSRIINFYIIIHLLI